MKTTPELIKKALYFSANKHNGQYRKGGSIPYIAHPVLVCFAVKEYTSDEEVIAASLLHDTLECCNDVSIKLLKKEFGDRVAELVDQVSFLDRDKKDRLPWVDRKGLYLRKLMMASNEALIIVAVDKMANMEGYFNAIRSGVDVSKLPFGGKNADYYWYYMEIGNILKTKIPENAVTKDYLDTLTSYINQK